MPRTSALDKEVTRLTLASPSPVPAAARKYDNKRPSQGSDTDISAKRSKSASSRRV